MTALYLLLSQEFCFFVFVFGFILVLKHVYCSKENSLFTLSDSLASLQAIYNLKNDHPMLAHILELYMELTRDAKEIVFI